MFVDLSESPSKDSSFYKVKHGIILNPISLMQTTPALKQYDDVVSSNSVLCFGKSENSWKYLSPLYIGHSKYTITAHYNV